LLFILNNLALGLQLMLNAVIVHIFPFHVSTLILSKSSQTQLKNSQKHWFL
jgi:hypothetical protein